MYSSLLIGLITFAMSQHASSSSRQLQRAPLAAQTGCVGKALLIAYQCIVSHNV